MKKVFLSGALIISFILYGLHQQDEAKNAIVVAPNLASGSTATPIATVPPTDTPTPLPGDTPAPTAVPTATPAGKYKDGSYTGSVADAFYGNIQVQAVISGGKITAVNFLQYPSDRSTSMMINRQAMPYLQQEAITAQSAQVDGVSGASDTSAAFIQSLTAALAQAS